MKECSFMDSTRAYRFYLDGILSAVVFSEDDLEGVFAYLQEAYPFAKIELRII